MRIAGGRFTFPGSSVAGPQLAAGGQAEQLSWNLAPRGLCPELEGAGLTLTTARSACFQRGCALPALFVVVTVTVTVMGFLGRRINSAK